MRKLPLAVLFTLAGCGANPTDVESNRSATQSFEVSVAKEGLSLLDTVQVRHLAGSLTGCDHKWEIAAAAGTIIAPADCQEPVLYESAVITKDGTDIELSFAGAASDDATGNAWRFLERDGVATITSSFSSESREAITVERSRYGVEVAIEEGDGAICDPQDPFRIDEDGFGQIVVSLTPPADGVPADLKLSADQEGVLIDAADNSFTIDSLALSAGEHVFTNLRAAFGSSHCTLTKLTLNIVETTTGGTDATLEDFFSALVFAGPDSMAENRRALSLLEKIVAKDGQEVPDMLASLLSGETKLKLQPDADQPYPKTNYYYSNGADIAHVLGAEHAFVSIGLAHISHVHTAAALVVKGDVDISHATRGPCFVVATGNVDISFAKDCFIVAKGEVNISFNTNSYILQLGQ